MYTKIEVAKRSFILRGVRARVWQFRGYNSPPDAKFEVIAETSNIEKAVYWLRSFKKGFECPIEFDENTEEVLQAYAQYRAASPDIAAAYYLPTGIRSRLGIDNWITFCDVSGEDAFVRELCDLAMDFEKWACRNVDFAQFPGRWLYDVLEGDLAKLVIVYMLSGNGLPSGEILLKIFKCAVPENCLRQAPKPLQGDASAA